MLKQNILALIAALSLLSFSAVFAAETSDVYAPDKQAAFGDAQAGKSKAASCGACHGRDGNSAIAINPSLAGQGAKYLYKQMKDFQSGARQNAIMPAQLANLSDEDLKDIAAYYASQKATSGTVKKEFVELGQKIYRGGNAESGVPACIACHGPAGKGMAAAGFPALAGQMPAYTEAQLKAFRAAGRGDHGGAKRNNDSIDGGPAMMQDAASALTDDEIQAVSSYIHGLR